MVRDSEIILIREEVAIVTKVFTLHIGPDNEVIDQLEESENDGVFDQVVGKVILEYVREKAAFWIREEIRIVFKYQFDIDARDIRRAVVIEMHRSEIQITQSGHDQGDEGSTDQTKEYSDHHLSFEKANEEIEGKVERYHADRGSE